MNEHKVIVLTGACIGLFAVILIQFGNPSNMGICVACFLRDIAGGLGLHQAEVVQNLRPEIPGFILGAFLLTLFNGEFRPTGGSAPLIRFLLGMFVMIGALVFLGCPLRMVLRIASGDLNAVTGLFGFAVGIVLGTQFIIRGFSLGRAFPQGKPNGYILPAIAGVLVLWRVINPDFIRLSSAGPGSMYAPIAISLGLGLLVGGLAQRSRFCMAGGIRDLYLIRDPHLMLGSLVLLVVAATLNLVTGQFQLGFLAQPIAHNAHIWNFLGMVLVGLGSVLLGGCPLRQVILASEGNTDAGVTVFGMLFGAGIAHNFGIAGSPQGVGVNGQLAVVFAILVSLAIGLAIIRQHKFSFRKGGETIEA